MSHSNWNNNPPVRRLKENEELHDYLLEIEANPRRTSKGWSVRCLYPDHQDTNNSGVVFDDGVFHCFAGCKRFGLRGANSVGNPPEERYEPKVVRGTVDYFDYWLSLEPLEEGIKGLPARHLNSLGWRKIEDNNKLGTKGGIFIPYFTMDRREILFYQIRHTEGTRRFTFTPGVTPIANGYESLNSMAKYLPFTEGASDRAVLEYIGVPTVALPSASSGALLKGLAKYAKSEQLIPVACSDNDDAGNRLLSALSGVSTYIDLRPPSPYKDFGDMFEALGGKGVRRYLRLLLPREPKPAPPPEVKTQWIDEEELKERHPESWQILFAS